MKARNKSTTLLVSSLVVLGMAAILVPLTRGWFSEDHLLDLDEGSMESVLGYDQGLRHHKIFDRGYRELAVSFMMRSLYARPVEIKDIDQVAGLLGERLGLDARELGRKLKSERSFVWLERRLPGNKAEAVLRNRPVGVYAVREAHRIYPLHRSGAHVVGFVEGNKGLAGVELNYERILHSREDGIKDPKGDRSGHLQLTLDLRIQELLAKELSELLGTTKATSGTGIVMNYKTGAVLAMASLPDYDPNSYWDVGSDVHLNRAVNGALELGGFSSLFGLAAAYEMAGDDNRDRLASLRMDLLIDNLPKRQGPDKWVKGQDGDWLSPEFGGWREKIFAEKGKETLLGRSGLFGKSGIDLPETDSLLDERAGITTPLRLLSGFAALVNGGKKITPYVGEAVIDPDSGRRRAISHSKESSELIRSSASRKIVELFSMKHGSARKAIFLESLMPVTAPVEVSQENHDVGESEVRYRTVLIGFEPDLENGLAMLLALDKAVAGAEGVTQMRETGKTVLERIAGLAAEQIEMPTPEVMAFREKRIFESWLGAQEYDQLVANVVKAKVEEKTGLMPDLHGLSLRKGLRALQSFGVNVEVVGSGRIFAQEPAAGAVFSGGTCRLVLRSDYRSYSQQEI